MQAEQNLFVALPSASLQLLGSSVLGEFSECLVGSGFAEWFHLRVSHKIAVKMWAGSVSSEGLIKAEGSTSKMAPSHGCGQEASMLCESLHRTVWASSQHDGWLPPEQVI